MIHVFTVDKEGQCLCKIILVTGRHTGLYVCEADNGVGRPAVGAVYVRVLRKFFEFDILHVLCCC